MKMRNRQPPKNAEACPYYALMATSSLSNKYQNWIMQTWSHGKHYWTANILKYRLHKQFQTLKYTTAAAPCEINEGAHQAAQTIYGGMSILCSHGNWKLEKKLSKLNDADLISWETLLNSKYLVIWSHQAIPNINIYICCHALRNKWRCAPDSPKKMRRIVHTMLSWQPRAWAIISKLNYANLISWVTLLNSKYP